MAILKNTQTTRFASQQVFYLSMFAIMVDVVDYGGY